MWKFHEVLHFVIPTACELRVRIRQPGNSKEHVFDVLLKRHKNVLCTLEMEFSIQIRN